MKNKNISGSHVPCLTNESVTVQSKGKDYPYLYSKSYIQRSIVFDYKFICKVHHDSVLSSLLYSIYIYDVAENMMTFYRLFPDDNSFKHKS